MSASAPAAAPARQFAFFDVVPVKDVHDLASSPEAFRAAAEISCLQFTKAGLLLADIHGSIHILNKDFEPVAAWIAHVGGRVSHMVERKGVLVTLGEEDAVRFPLLKIWDLQKLDKKTGAPALLRSVKVQPSNRPHPISTVALSASLSHLALGLGDGTVLLYRHLDQSLSASTTSLTALPKPRVIHESPTEPVTGLGFREPTADAPHTSLFIVTTARVLAYQATGRGSGGAPAVVDEVGAALGCACMDWRARDVVVARDEAVYVCGTEGRGACYAHEGIKSAVHTHAHYVVLVSPPFAPSASAASATVRNFVAAGGGAGDIAKVTVFDPENPLIAYSGTFADGVRAVVSAWGELYVLSNDGKLSWLRERPMAEKLEMLYRKGQYTLALSMARAQGLDAARVADIHRAYGDHLYAKPSYDAAMRQFVQTIGFLQPSYVIRKFLDAQRIHNLVTYLQELHALGRANADHTTLLLNTYTKLKDVARLDAFIRTETRRPAQAQGEEGAAPGADADADTDELPFDLDTAIRVCRQAGYFEHAGYLARKYARHEDYLRIQIEDAGNYADALAYLRRLGAEAAEANLARYGRAMLDNLPDETTQLLIDICTNTGPLDFDPELALSLPLGAPSRQPTGGGGPSYLSYLALNRDRGSTSESIAPSTAPTTGTGTTVRPSDQARRQGSVAAAPGDDASSGGSTPATPAPAGAAQLKPRPGPGAVRRPSPRVYFAHFVEHLDRFVVFLETVALRRWGQSADGGAAPAAAETERERDDPAEKEDQAAVWNTLLELYLTLPAPGAAGGAHAGAWGDRGKAEAAFRAKALRLLRARDIPCDATQALILCAARAFTPGLVLLWERRGMHEDVLRFWMDRHREGAASDPDEDASAKVVECVKAYGPARPQLYPLVLRFLTSTPALLAKHATDIAGVLERIEEEKIMSPVAVVQVLSRNGVASVGLVKQWLMTRIKEAREEIQTDEQLISSYRLETKAKLKQVEELADADAPRVFHVTRCSACGGALDLPAVHFMCNHSYHQRCLADHETECPNCARAHGVIREIRRNNERLADQHELFLSDVQESGFGAVAAAFGRGVLSTPRIEDVNA